jgi:hypothetical protein
MSFGRDINMGNTQSLRPAGKPSYPLFVLTFTNSAYRALINYMENRQENG